jgi:hypothetical protein
MALNLIECGAGDGNRTRTPLTGPRILSPVRLPVPPPRHSCSQYPSHEMVPRKLRRCDSFAALSRAPSSGKTGTLPSFAGPSPHSSSAESGKGRCLPLESETDYRASLTEVGARCSPSGSRRATRPRNSPLCLRSSRIPSESSPLSWSSRARCLDRWTVRLQDRSVSW